jgi:uncharacterized protein (DUF302 family)
MNIRRPFAPALFAATPAFVASAAAAADGLIEVKSPHGMHESMDRLEGLVKQRGLNVFARIDHAAGASRIGERLRPTQLLIFGNPQGGTPFMQCAQAVGIDLPLTALVREDAAAQAWIGCNDPGYLERRHGVENCPAVEGLRKALSGLVDAVVAE